MLDEDEYLPLSALQHYRCCPRQCAFIHLEQLWIENRLTAEGRAQHEKVDSGGHEVADGVRIRRTLALKSHQLCIAGIADVVEFHPQSNGTWRPFPVEYKHGKPEEHDWNSIQLCAQALCLEEMLQTSVPEGALFYWTTRHRQTIIFDELLRQNTLETAQALHAMWVSGRTPSAELKSHCHGCSFYDICKPEVIHSQGARKYLEKIWSQP